MLNRERLTKYLEQISSEIDIINSILVHNDEEILESKHFLRSLKYSTVVIAEAIANTLQHILAKKFKVTVSGYKEVLIKSRDNQVVSSELLGNLHPFIRFRNMLIHQY
ncbi:MAG TPA: HepT-like ribonuclease domain-containing protein [bacterium]